MDQPYLKAFGGELHLKSGYKHWSLPAQNANVAWLFRGRTEVFNDCCVPMPLHFYPPYQLELLWQKCLDVLAWAFALQVRYQDLERGQTALGPQSRRQPLGGPPESPLTLAPLLLLHLSTLSLLQNQSIPVFSMFSLLFTASSLSQKLIRGK